MGQKTLSVFFAHALAGFVAVLAAALAATPQATAQYYDGDDRYYSRDYDRNYGGGYRGNDDRSYYEDDAPDVSFFYAELADEGRWISHREFGFVWTPHGVSDDWRPYSRGSWAYTDDYGWYWISEEPFGWATYHYGRWFFDDRYGWLWVPGTTWGPAWVAWRSSDDYIGWAPLPPDAYWDSRVGLRYDVTLYESPRFAFYWSFIEPRYITTASIYRYCAPRHRARTIIYRTRPHTSYTYVNARIVNGGISLSFVERHIGAPVKRVHVYTTESRRARGYDRKAGDVIRVWRPDFKKRDKWTKQKTVVKLPKGTWHDVDRPKAARPVYSTTPGRDTSTWGNVRNNYGPNVAPQTNSVVRQPAPVKRPPWFSYDKYRKDEYRSRVPVEKTNPNAEWNKEPKHSERGANRTGNKKALPDEFETNSRSHPEDLDPKLAEDDAGAKKRNGKQRRKDNENGETGPPASANSRPPPYVQNPGKGTGAFDNLR